MHEYWNFYCSPAKKYGSDPHFFWAGDATELVSEMIVCVDLIKYKINKM